MRVLHVLPSLATSFGGPAQAMLSFAQVLSDRGIDCDVAACLAASETAVDLVDRAAAPGRGAITVHCFVPSMRLYKVCLRLARWLVANVRHYDVIHVHGLFSFPPLFAAFVACCARRPYVIRPFGVLNRYGLTARRPLAKRISMKLVEKPLLKRAACVHYTSEAEREQATAAGARGVAVVLPLGVPELAPGDPQVIRRRFPQLLEAPLLVTLTRLDPKKNLEALIDAVALIRGRGRPVMLLVCGDGEPVYREQLIARASRAGVSDSIVWAGDVRGAAKASALAAADLFVLPTISENFGISVVEALASGKPVVVSEGVPMHAAIAAGGAGVVSGIDPVSIAAALDHCLGGDFDLRRAGVAARKLAQDAYSLKSFGDQLVDTYKSIVATR